MARVKRAVFRFLPFSKKQWQLLTWWRPESGVADMDGIIADGAIRSGKTVSMALSFVVWAMAGFRGETFAMCGKTIGSFRRNVLPVLKLMLLSRGFRFTDRRADNLLEIRRQGAANYFYIFGGKDERAQDLIQGITLAGVLFDEAALMPESFVNQATGRCSVDGSKYWFNCNPANPSHWFKAGWIDKREEKRLLYLHFTMDDNPSLTERVKERYRSMYAGVFYSRYVLGQWVAAEGRVYPMYDNTVPAEDRDYSRYVISMDYGTQNPTAMLLWGRSGGVWYALREYYHSGRETGTQKTDQQYYNELVKLAGGLPIFRLIIDPSAASFIALVEQERKFKVWDADNAVLDGIRHVAQCLDWKLILFNSCCRRTIQEFESYAWDEKATEDRPMKTNDHAMDAVRYFVETMGIYRRKQADAPM